jgi:hypothetical protein
MAMEVTYWQRAHLTEWAPYAYMSMVPQPPQLICAIGGGGVGISIARFTVWQQEHCTLMAPRMYINKVRHPPQTNCAIVSVPWGGTAVTELHSAHHTLLAPDGYTNKVWQPPHISCPCCCVPCIGCCWYGITTTTKALKSPYFPFPRLSISEQSQDLSSPPTAFFFFFSPSLSLSLSSAKIPPQVYCSIKPLHIVQSNNNTLELTLSPDRCHTPPRQIRCESRELRCNRSSYVGVQSSSFAVVKQARRSNTRCF